MTRSPTVVFGHDFDDGETALVRDWLPVRAHDALAEAGFHYPGSRAGVLRQSSSRSSQSQLLWAAQAVRELDRAGVRVRNRHPPFQSGRALVRHYAWLNGSGSFPFAATTASRIQDLARTLLDQRTLTPSGTAQADELVHGELLVEEACADGDREWWLARRTGADGNYLVLRYDAALGLLGVTDEFARWYSEQARRDFRAQYLRDTTVPAARSAAARPVRPARLSAAPSAPPPDPGGAARRVPGPR